MFSDAVEGLFKDTGVIQVSNSNYNHLTNTQCPFFPSVFKVVNVKNYVIMKISGWAFELLMYIRYTE